MLTQKNRHIILFFVIIGGIIFYLAQPTQLHAPTEPTPNSEPNLSVYEQTAIRSEKKATTTSKASQPKQAQGVGIPLAPRLVLTNAHVVSATGHLYTVGESGAAQSEVINVRVHPTRDLALLQVVTTGAWTVRNMFSRTERDPEIGQQLTYTTSKNRPETCTVSTAIQQDGMVGLTGCTIGHGMSGTPLYDQNESVVGLITATTSSGGHATPLTDYELRSRVETLSSGYTLLSNP